jgi:hypothetical protein
MGIANNRNSSTPDPPSGAIPKIFSMKSTGYLRNGIAQTSLLVFAEAGIARTATWSFLGKTRGIWHSTVLIAR